MKRSFIIATLMSLSLSTVLAQVAKAKLTPEEIAEKKKAAIARRYAMTGGVVVQPNNDRRVLALVNVDQAMNGKLLSEIADSIGSGTRLPVVASDMRPDNAGIVVEIKDSDYPATFITAPENGYAMLNVRRLKTDNPSSDILSRRLTQEVWRVVIMVLGGGYDAEPKCLMKPFATLAELDACPSTCPCPMNLSAASTGAARFGVVPERQVLYRTAVAEGWAPPPTNDVQRAIFEQVKAEQSEKPSNPIRILPGQKPSGK